MKVKRKTIYRVLLVALTVVFIWACSPKSYEIVVLDENGYFVDFWNDIKTYEVKDSILYLEGGLIEYRMKPGEKIEVHDYPG
jgi:hypothetical protein